MKVLTVPQSGSVAGQTASRNRFGQYLRTRATPVNPNTTAQSTVRAGFADSAALWRTLSAARQAAWNYLALANPRTDSLGQQITLSGFQMFVGVAALMMGIGQSPVLDAPLGSGIGAPVITVDDNSLAGPMALAFDPDPVPTAHNWAYYSSPPVSLGTTFNGDYRFINVLNAGVAGPRTLNTDLALKWGTLQAGQRFFLRSKLVAVTGTNAGWSSPDSNIVMLDVVA